MIEHGLRDDGECLCGASVTFIEGDVFWVHMCDESDRVLKTQPAGGRR